MFSDMFIVLPFNRMDYPPMSAGARGDTVQAADSHPQGSVARKLHQSSSSGYTRAAAVSIGAILGLASLALSVHNFAEPAIYRIDFLQDYVLARAVGDRTNPYLPTAQLVAHYLGRSVGSHFPHPTPHPPPDGILFLPLAALDYLTAARVWYGLELLFLILSVYFLARLEGWQWSPWRAIFVAIVLNSWYPVAEDLASGQVMLFLLLLLVFARLSLRSGHRTIAGVLTGFAILVKPVPWPFLLLFLVRRDWRVLAASLGTTAAGYAASLVLLGRDHLVFYFTHVLPAVTTAYRGIARNLSLWSVGWRMFDGTPQTVFGGTVIPAIDAPPIIRWPEAAVLLSFILPSLVVLYACIRTSKLDVGTGFGVMTCASILASPMSWSNYLVLALIPVAELMARMTRRELAAHESAALMVVLVALFIPIFAWAGLAFLIAGQPIPANLTGSLPVGPSLLTLVPSLAVAALGWLEGSRFPSNALPNAPRAS